MLSLFFCPIGVPKVACLFALGPACSSTCVWWSVLSASFPFSLDLLGEKIASSVVVVSMKSLSSLALAGGLGCISVRMSVAVVLGVCCAGFVCCGLGVCMLSVSVMVEVVCDGIWEMLFQLRVISSFGSVARKIFARASAY